MSNILNGESPLSTVMLIILLIIGILNVLFMTLWSKLRITAKTHAQKCMDARKLFEEKKNRLLEDSQTHNKRMDFLKAGRQRIAIEHDAILWMKDNEFRQKLLHQNGAPQDITIHSHYSELQLQMELQKISKSAVILD